MRSFDSRRRARDPSRLGPVTRRMQRNFERRASSGMRQLKQEVRPRVLLAPDTRTAKREHAGELTRCSQLAPGLPGPRPGPTVRRSTAERSRECCGSHRPRSIRHEGPVSPLHEVQSSAIRYKRVRVESAAWFLPIGGGGRGGAEGGENVVMVG